MTLILSGTNGLSDVDGSASTPAIRGTDSNTGIFFPAADTIAFAEGGAEVARFDSSGNFGVGTSSPPAGSRVAVSGGALNFTDTSARDILWGTSNYVYITGNQGTGVLAMGTGSTERARINSIGQFGIGFSAPNANLVVGGVGGTGWVAGARNTLQLRNSNGGGNQSNFIVFGSAASESYCTIGNDINANGTTVNQLNIQAGSSGGVYLASGGTSWTSSSDERVKDIIEPITDAAAKVSTLRAVIGKYKTDDEGKRRSFLIAQDVQAVLPEAITVGADENNTLGLSYTDTIPLLVAAIKEQQGMIQELTAKLDAAEARIAALEAK